MADIIRKDNSLVRYIQAFVFVAIYIALGFLLKLDKNYYLLIGIPLTLIFQLFVRRQPIHKLWVKNSMKFQLNKWGIMIAVFLCAYPAKRVISMVIQGEWNASLLIYIVTIMGAVAAGYALTQFTKITFRLLLLCLATAGSIGVLLFVGVAVVRQTTHPSIHSSLLMGVKSMLINFPVCFMLEEVVFRGAIDSHVHQPEQKKGLGSAIFVSALWGLWHLPVFAQSVHNAKEMLLICLTLVIVHTCVGVPLSIFWRKSGNLAVPAFSHAFADSVRNALLSNL